MSNPFRKDESIFVHNIRQLAGCVPLLGCLTVGILGLVAFFRGLENARGDQPAWLIGSVLGLFCSLLAFGVLAWVAWRNREL
jgi:hypothetical protein